MRKSRVMLVLAGLLLGGVATAQTIDCAKCTCNVNTGICECEDCVFVEDKKID